MLWRGARRPSSPRHRDNLLHARIRCTSFRPGNFPCKVAPSPGEKRMKAMLITVVAATLAVGPAVRAQDLVKDTHKAADKTADVTKDTSKDVAHGTKKAANKTADVTKDTSKDVVHGTTKAAKKTGHAVDTGAKDTGKAAKKGADKTADAVKEKPLRVFSRVNRV